MSIVYEERDALAFVRLARAARGNALTGAMLARLGEIFEGVARRRDLRAVILSGEGENFCAGTDGAEPAAFDAAGARLR
ncbi:MAG TPA: enoyl-CoA hydratase-related protein, partial [Pyrinomonadaceae bacterium]